MQTHLLLVSSNKKMVSSIDSRGLGLKSKAAFNLSELAGQTVLSVNGTGQF